jgi:cation transport ATPase
MGTGTDVAIESAKINLSERRRYGGIVKPKTKSCSHENINQNLFFAFLYNVPEYPLQQEFYIRFSVLLSPMIAAL